MHVSTFINAIYTVMKYGVAFKASSHIGSFKPIMYSYSGLTIVAEKVLSSNPVNYIATNAYNLAASSYRYFATSPKEKILSDMQSSASNAKEHLSSYYNTINKEGVKSTLTDLLDWGMVRTNNTMNIINAQLADVKPAYALLIGYCTSYFAGSLLTKVHNYPAPTFLLVSAISYLDILKKGLSSLVPPAFQDKASELLNNASQYSSKDWVNMGFDALEYAYNYAYGELINSASTNNSSTILLKDEL
jgi:hypothetical protein